MGSLGKLYDWFWYHVEFWITPEDRRPFTFIIRDFYHENPLFVLLFTSFGMYAVGRWWFQLSVKDYFIYLGLLLIGILLGHLYWAKWEWGEQEYPECIEPRQ